MNIFSIFGTQSKDSDNLPIPVPSGFNTVDASASPKSSPLALDGTLQIITKPKNAVEVIFFPLAHDLTVSEDPANASNYTVVAGTSEVFECAKMPFIYIQGTNGDTLNFRFNYI